MFTVSSIEINGFWRKHSIKAEFKEDVNVIIGRNGTGKTTFMNILHGILAVDLDALQANQFDSASVILVNENGQKRTVKVTKNEDTGSPFTKVEYKISSNKYVALLAPTDEQFRSGMVRRQMNLQAASIRDALKEMISLASLSVYRIKNESDIESKERPILRRHASPVDARLFELTQQLTHYQLELSQKAQKISIDLQKQVLTSLLYEKEKHQNLSLDFNASEERIKLTQAYAQLGLTGPGILKRITDHVNSIEKAFAIIKNKDGAMDFDFSAIDAKRRTEKVIRLSLTASSETAKIYSQINTFIDSIGSFISEKKFSLVGGELKVDAGGSLPLEKLSSGEKQLLILFIEAVLQRQQPYVFLADEPELSLHIAWQRRIVPAIQLLNPNAQIIVATHSPEVAGRYDSSTIDMEDLIHAAS